MVTFSGLRCSLLVAGLVCLAPAAAAAQGAVDTVREHRFADSTDTAVVALRQSAVYTAELTGPGTPAFTNPRTGKASAFVQPVAAGLDTAVHRFEVYPYRTGLHVVRIAGLPAGAATHLRLSSDLRETQRIAAREYRKVRFGIMVGAGTHAGYLIARPIPGDTTPGRGTDWEVALLAQILDRLDVSAGFTEQSFPGVGFSAHWVFGEARVRIVSANLLAGHRTDFAAALRYSETEGYGTDNVDPWLLSWGGYIVQHLSEGSRGWSVALSWEHGRAHHTNVTENVDTDRFMAAIRWVY